MSGWMNELGGLLGEGAGGAGGAGTHEAVGGLLSNALQSAGGVQGLLARANQAGLGQHVQSWIGDGSNLPISPSEITRIFPPEQIDQFAQAHGIPAGTVTSILSTMLPHAVDQATPDNDPQAADQSQAASGAGGFDFAGLAKRFLGS